MWPWTTKVKFTSEGYNSVEVIKVYKPTKSQVRSWFHLKELKANLKYHVTWAGKVKVTGHNSVEVNRVYTPTKHQV